MNLIGKRISLVFIGKVVSYIITILIAYQCSNIYGNEYYGKLVYVITLSHILSSFFTFGISNKIEKLVFVEDDKTIITSILKEKFFLCFLLSISLCFCSVFFYLLFNTIFGLNYDLITLIGIVIAVIRTFLLVTIRALRSVKNYKLYALGEVPNQILFLILISYINFEFNKVLSVLTLTWLLSLGFYLTILFKKYNSNVKIKWKNLINSKSDLKEQFKVMLNSNMVLLGENLPVFILRKLDYNLVGIFDILKKLTSLTVFILPVTNSIIGPYSLNYFKQNRYLEFQKLALRVSKISLLISILYFLVIIYDINISLMIFDFFNIENNLYTNIAIYFLMLAFLIHVVSGANNLILNLNNCEGSLLRTNFLGIFIFFTSILISPIFFNDLYLINVCFSMLIYYIFINYRNLHIVKKNFGIKMSILQI